MKTAVLRFGVLTLLVSLAVACDKRFTSPTIPTAHSPARTPAPAPPPAPLGNLSATFGSAVAVSYPLSSYTLASRFVFFDTGQFSLQFPNGDYQGTYTQSGTAITFQWEGWSTAGPWGATATLSGDKLTVDYNTVMELTDFEDAVYTRIK